MSKVPWSRPFTHLGFYKVGCAIDNDHTILLPFFWVKYNPLNLVDTYAAYLFLDWRVTSRFPDGATIFCMKYSLMDDCIWNRQGTSVYCQFQIARSLISGRGHCSKCYIESLSTILLFSFHLFSPFVFIPNSIFILSEKYSQEENHLTGIVNFNTSLFMQ